MTVVMDGGGMDEDRQALGLQQEALRQIHLLIDQLEEGDLYREILERHVGGLEEAVRQLAALVKGSG